MFHRLPDAAPDTVSVVIDGEPATAQAGESVAAVLLRQREAWSRLTPVSESRRAPYCMMGVCFECLAEVDGTASTQTCLVPVHEGMVINRQRGSRSLED